MNLPTPPLDKTAGDAAADDPDRLLLSALVDGDGDAVERGCKGWQRDPALRARWHTYHLIGDVLRSDELASTPRHDARVLEGVRARLAREPVLVAPQLPQPAVRGRAAAPWRVPA
ncbi:MAG: sigma-E factor negative regulatory protein, partial [Burkholderiales bacterium]|nr:sigma-E factor negative regulatory protein [Burkholderiales bacterium]